MFVTKSYWLFSFSLDGSTPATPSSLSGNRYRTSEYDFTFVVWHILQIKQLFELKDCFFALQYLSFYLQKALSPHLLPCVR